LRLFETNWMQIEEYLRRDDRIVLPTGSTEQHGFLSLGTDAILAERVAVEAAEPLGIPVLPAPPEPKPVIPRDLVGQLDPAQVAAAAPDGMLGGAYARPDEDMQVVWDAGVAEVRALLEEGWLR
jgi:hypothetical protein